jgi:hypothetical protein
VNFWACLPHEMARCSACRPDVVKVRAMLVAAAGNSLIRTADDAGTGHCYGLRVYFKCSWAHQS